MFLVLIATLSTYSTKTLSKYSTARWRSERTSCMTLMRCCNLESSVWSLHSLLSRMCMNQSEAPCTAAWFKTSCMLNLVPSSLSLSQPYKFTGNSSTDSGISNTDKRYSIFKTSRRVFMTVLSPAVFFRSFLTWL